MTDNDLVTGEVTRTRSRAKPKRQRRSFAAELAIMQGHMSNARNLLQSIQHSDSQVIIGRLIDLAIRELGDGPKLPPGTPDPRD